MSKKLKGHKPACKCVGCSAATRARGMKKLGLTKRRRHRNMKKRLSKKVVKKVHSTRRPKYKGKTVAKAFKSRTKAMVRGLAKLKKFPNSRKSRSVGRTRALRVHSKMGQGVRAIRRALRSGKTAYGISTGSKKVGRFRARTRARIEASRRHSNPSGNLIGTSPVIHFASRSYAFKGARLMTGPGEFRVTITGIKGKRYPVGPANIRAIDYRHDQKAMRAYGRIAPFRHRFTSPARVLSSGGGRIVIESSRRIWEKQ